MIAALYVSPHGPYVAMPGVDAWPRERDATVYAGPWSVVAHPPCAKWGRYHFKAYDDGSMGPIAVAQVRRWGGVLEHPRDSRLWDACAMAYPDGFPDEWGGYTIRVRQCDWGHPAEKPTWLYIVGCPRDALPAPPPHRPAPTRPPCPSGARGVCERLSSRQRQLTPPAFAAWLVKIATEVIQ